MGNKVSPFIFTESEKAKYVKIYKMLKHQKV